MSDDTSGTTSKTKPKTDWRRLRSMTDEEVHAAMLDDPDAKPTDEAFWKEARVVMPRRKETVTLRLDADLLEWFRRERGYQTRINAILRAYMNAHAGDRRSLVGLASPRRRLRPIALEHEWRRPLLHALRHVRHVRTAGERAPDARHRPRPNPRRQNFGLPWCRRHVRRLRHHHHVERGALNCTLKPFLIIGD